MPTHHRPFLARARLASAAAVTAAAAVVLASACEPRPQPSPPPPAWHGPPGGPPPQYVHPGAPGPAAPGGYTEYEEYEEYGEPWPDDPERVAEAPEPEPEPRRPPARAPRPDPVAEPAPARTPPPRDRPAKPKDRPARPKDAPDKPKADEPGGPLAGILAAHNSARARHCAPPLLWSAEVAATAQKWAAKLRDSGCAFEHNPRTKYGENLAFFAPSGSAGPDGVTRTWYDENELYDYDKGRFSFETGHFTQLVWRDTTQLGCAVVQCRGGDIWVCNYHPAGNVQGLFKKNVLPPSCRKR